MSRYKLKLKQLDFVSLVDDPAQPNAKCLLIKRAGKTDEVSATARLVKTSDELGLAFFWAFTSTNPDGSEHFDLHSDQVLADNDMIKAAAEFMEKGGAVDEMHDSAQTGHVVFAMPMTPEIASAYGVTTKTSGLMVAIRPSAEAMAKLKDGTYSAVSIAGLGEREAVKAAGVKKSAQLYTDEVDGHQHQIDVYGDGTFYVHYATMTDAEYSHNHGMVLGPDGAPQILADSGHTHELAEGQPSLVVVAPDAVVIVQASAKWTRSTERTDAHSTPEESNMTTPADKQTFDLTKQLEGANKQVESLTAKLEAATKLASLSDAQRSFYKTLTGIDAEQFISKSYADRELDVAVEYTAKDGTVYRKHEDRRLIEMAKRQDKMTEDLAKRDEEIEKAEIAELAKSVLGSVTGEDEVHQYIVKSVRKGGGNAAMIEKALTSLRGANAMAKSAQKAKGYNPGADPVANSAEAALETIAQKIATEKNVDIAKARDMALDTPEGQAAYTEMRKRKAVNQPTA